MGPLQHISQTRQHRIQYLECAIEDQLALYVNP